MIRVGLHHRRQVLRAAVLVAVCGAVAAELRTQSAEILLEEALYHELTLADMDRAAETYRRVIETVHAPRAVLATAHLRLGLCLRWRGAADAARAHFELAVKQSAAENETVRLARRYLGQPVLDNPAVFVPRDVLVYVEVVEPRENIRGLSALLEGTPFQNPVDTYIASLARASPRAEISPREPAAGPPARVPQQAAFFNEGFLREMELIEALAFAVPGDGDPRHDFIAVLDPGGSNIFRGLVNVGLAISQAEPVGSAGEAALFRLREEKRDPEDPGVAGDPDRRLHVALARDFILLGRPRQLVETSVERGTGRRESLAGDELFRRAQAGRGGGIVFGYLGRERLVERLREDAAGGDREVFDACAAALGVSRFNGIGVTLKHRAVDDTLALELGAHVETEGFPLWQALAAPPLRPEILGAVPRDPLGFFATRCDGATSRVDALFRAAQPLTTLLEARGDREAAQITRTFREFLASPGAAPFLESIDGVVAGFTAAGEPTEPPPFFAALELRPGAGGVAVVEGLLTALCHHFFRNAASREFQDATISHAGASVRARVLEPLPGRRLHLRRLSGGAVLVAQNERDLFEPAPHEPAWLEERARGAGKLAVVYPRRAVERLGARLQADPGARLVLGEVERLVFVAGQEQDSVAWSLQVPGATPAARAVLLRAAQELAPRR